MLRDPKARALADGFAAQWLQTRALKDVTPDPALFPDFDEPLRAADARRDRDSSAEAIIREDRSVLDFLDADYTFVNERLARHYGIAGRRRRPIPPGLARRHPPRRRPDPGERPDGHVEPDPDLAGQAGQVGPREHPRHAAAARRRRAWRR